MALHIRGGMYTAFMLSVTLRFNRAPQFVLSSLTILLSLLIIINAIAHGARKIIGGYEGIIFGLFVAVAALAHMLNKEYGKVVAPL